MLTVRAVIHPMMEFSQNINGIVSEFLSFLFRDEIWAIKISFNKLFAEHIG